MNLIEVFQPSLRGRAERTAFQCGTQTLSFGQLDRLSDTLALKLRDEIGLRRGERAAMFVENCLELLIYYLACLKAGAIVVPFNVLYRGHELEYLLDDARPTVLLTDSERLPVLKSLRAAQEPSLKMTFVADAPAGDGRSIYGSGGSHSAFCGPAVNGDDPALLVYTSGTTGRCKGAVMTHNNLSSNIISLLHCWQWTENDRFLLALPMFHMHGLGNGIHGAIASGCATFIMRRFKAADVLELLVRERGTLFFGVPAMYERLLEAAAGGSVVPDSVRLYVSGSAPLSTDTFSRFKSVFGQEILERYGMSETAMIASNLYAGPRKQGAVGTPLPGVRVRIANAGDSGVGEIQVRGPNVFREYWNAPEKTAESFDDGWFKTGDLGSIDADGFLTISGRGKELIISGGFNIYPQEVIQCICGHPGVMEAAVIGVPDKVRGELVKAYVVKKDAALTAEQVMEFCKQRLASFKAPKSVAFLDTLPRNAMGKLQLNLLPGRESP
jgi:malonyl-CoA/methylmalonyl-CoA synthetase